MVIELNFSVCALKVPFEGSMSQHFDLDWLLRYPCSKSKSEKRFFPPIFEIPSFDACTVSSG